MIRSVGSNQGAAVRPRRRFVRLTAAGLTVGVVTATIVGSTGGTAAAADLPQAQSVGRFVDGSAGGMPIESLADLVDARAKAAPNTSSRNPLEADVLSQLKVPLGTALQLPGGGVASLGVANQLAEARTNGYSYGASGAVANTGGVDLTDKQGDFPSTAKLNLSAAALSTVPIPGLPALPGLPAGSGAVPSAASLGGVTASIGAVRSLAQTKVGGTALTSQSSVANVNLNLGSPALGALLSQLKSALDPSTLNGTLSGISIPGIALPTGCSLTSPNVSNIYLESTGSPATAANSAITIDVTDATIAVNVGALVKKLLNKDISDLATSNFDLVDFLVKNLPSILSTGLSNAVTGLTNPLEAQFKACVTLINDIPVAGVITAPLIAQLLDALDSGRTALTDAIAGLSAQFSAASTGPLGQLASGLKQVVDIGLNVQSGPGSQPKESTYPFTTGLKATPSQATGVVARQSLVRAIEIDLLPAAAGGGGSLPPLPPLPAFRQAAPRAAVAGGGAAVIALANSAAGPSTAPTAVTSTPTTPTTGSPSSNPTGSPVLPTGIPAGAAGHQGGGSPALPIVLVLIGLVLAGGGVTAYRVRGRFSH